MRSKIINISIIMIGFFLLLLQSTNTQESQFAPNWGNYRRQFSYLAFTYQSSLSSTQVTNRVIAFDVPFNSMATQFHDGQNQILFAKDKNKGKLSNFKFRQNSVDQYAFQLEGNGNIQILMHQKPHSSCQNKQSKNKTWVSNQIFQLCPSCSIYSCDLPLNISSNQSNIKSWEQIQSQNQQRVKNFMGTRKISASYRDMVKYSITELIKSIRIVQSQFQFPYYMISQGQSDLQTSVRLSLLPIDIVGDYNKALGKWLCYNFLNFYQKKLLYSGRQFYIIPQHIEVVLKYYDPKDYKERSRIQSIFIGIIDSILLAPVNHIQQQMNYRQSNKIHPTIFRMLTIKFQTESPQLMASSIYTQSFMEDLFYHGPSRRLEMAMAKYMWLMKVIALCQFYSPQYKLKLNYIHGIIKMMLKQDQSVGKGFYRSTYSQGKMRFYVLDISYQSLLPFYYGVTETFPSMAYQNLTTPYGLTALPVSSQNYKQKGYRYRGNIHLYFSHLFCSTQQYSQQRSLRSKVEKIVTDFWANDRQIYTIWNAKGQPVESVSWLKIIATAFLPNQKLNSSE